MAGKTFRSNEEMTSGGRCTFCTTSRYERNVGYSAVKKGSCILNKKKQSFTTKPRIFILALVCIFERCLDTRPSSEWYFRIALHCQLIGVVLWWIRFGRSLLYENYFCNCFPFLSSARINFQFIQKLYTVIQSKS